MPLYLKHVINFTIKITYAQLIYFFSHNLKYIYIFTFIFKISLVDMGEKKYLSDYNRNIPLKQIISFQINTPEF